MNFVETRIWGCQLCKPGIIASIPFLARTVLSFHPFSLPAPRGEVNPADVVFRATDVVLTLFASSCSYARPVLSFASPTVLLDRTNGIHF